MMTENQIKSVIARNVIGISNSEQITRLHALDKVEKHKRPSTADEGVWKETIEGIRKFYQGLHEKIQ